MRHNDNRELLRQSFGEIAGHYDRFRPGPPEEAVRWLIPAHAHDILEIGAGTGALTRQLARGHAHVRAVEPDARMRAVLAERVPQAEVVAGQAERIPAEDASFDAVIAASSWHWVDEERAVPEVARVLRPGGTFSTLWNGPDRSVDWLRTLWAGGKALSDDQIRAVDSGRRARHTVDLGLDSPFLEPERHVIRWVKCMTKEELVGLAGTYSAVITMGEPERQEHLASSARFLETHAVLAGRAVIDVPMRCLCWRTQRR